MSELILRIFKEKQLLSYHEKVLLREEHFIFISQKQQQIILSWLKFFHVKHQLQIVTLKENVRQVYVVRAY